MTEATTTAAPAATTPVEVKLGDATFKVDPAVATALTEARKAAEAAGVAAKETEQRLTAQLEELRKQVPAKPAAPAGNEKDIDVLLFSNPKEAAAAIKQEAKDEIRAEMQAREDRAAFWTGFYAAFPELKEDDLVVQAVLSRDFASLKSLQVPEATVKLGESVQKYLLERGIDRKKTKKGGEIEGGTESGVRSPKKGTGEPSLQPTTSLTAVLRERQQKRRAASAGAAGQT